MTLPAGLIGWLPPGLLPPWAQLAMLVFIGLFAIALMMVPFAVFGLRGRLDLLEAQLDDIHAELRMLAMRLGDPEPSLASRSIAENGGRTEPRLSVPRLNVPRRD